VYLPQEIPGLLFWSSLTRGFSLRAEGPRPAVLALRTLLSCGALLVLAFAASWVALLAWADHLSRSDSLADREHAVRLAPAVPSLYERLADQHEAQGGDPLPDLERAASLDPANAGLHMRLGLRAELAGDFPLAEQNLLAAANLSRLYQPRYLLSQYYFRRQNADSFWRWTRAALDTAYGDASPLLELCWRLRPDGAWLEQHVLPRRPEIARQYLAFLVRRGQAGDARNLAERIAGSARAEDLPALLAYGDSRLVAGDGDAPTAVWNLLCRRGLLPDRPLDPARGLSLTNGDLRHAPTGIGFDWRFGSPSGIAVSPSTGELRLQFSGRQPEACSIGWQLVPLVRGARYRLGFQRQALDAASADGLGWSIEEPAGTPVETGQLPDGSLDFVSPAAVLRLILVYRRPPGEPRLEGAVAIRGVQLEMER